LKNAIVKLPPVIFDFCFDFSRKKTAVVQNGSG